jgi:dienelactone hydrolase
LSPCNASTPLLEQLIAPTELEHVALSGDGATVAYIERRGDRAALWVKHENAEARRVADWDFHLLNYQISSDGQSFLLLQRQADGTWGLSLLNCRSGTMVDVDLHEHISGFGYAGVDAFKVLTQDANYALKANSLDFSTGQLIGSVVLGEGDNLGYGTDGEVHLTERDGRWRRPNIREAVEFSAEGLGALVGTSNDGSEAIFALANRDDFGNFFVVDTLSGSRTLLEAAPTTDIETPLRSPVDGRVDGYLKDGVRLQWVALRPEVRASLEELEIKLGQVARVFARSTDDHRWLVTVGDTTESPTYFLFDRVRHTVTTILSGDAVNHDAKTPPAIVNTVKSQDGKAIQVWVSPPDALACNIRYRHCPFVVNLHGGPHHKDGHKYDRETDWLQHRGYWVLRVNYRGSTGFGAKFANESDHEWGGRVVDDIRAGLAWFKTLNGVDPTRGVAMGWSFGGFAATALAVADPTAVRCVDSVNGGGDLLAFATLVPIRQPTMAEDIRKEVGDPSISDQQLLITRQSPMAQLKKSPVQFLIEYGAKDTVSVPEESSNFVRALKKLDNPYVALRYVDQGHSLVTEQSRRVHYTVLERFLSNCTGTTRMQGPGLRFDHVVVTGSRSLLPVVNGSRLH